MTRLTRHWLFRLFAVTVACTAASRVTAQELTFSLDNNGLSALRFGTENFLPQVAQGRLVSGEETLRRKDGTTYKMASGTPLSTKLNAKDSRVTLSYAWGEFLVVMRQIEYSKTGVPWRACAWR